MSVGRERQGFGGGSPQYDSKLLAAECVKCYGWLLQIGRSGEASWKGLEGRQLLFAGQKGRGRSNRIQWNGL